MMDGSWLRPALKTLSKWSDPKRYRMRLGPRKLKVKIYIINKGVTHRLDDGAAILPAKKSNQ
jgi:hypothetical protein